jgi:small acid-soluble spore protein I (minor)
MNLNIRGAVLHNIKEMNQQQMEDLIQDSIQKGDEKYLPGLGVLFEVIWNHSDTNERNQMIETLHQQVEMSQPKPFN